MADQTQEALSYLVGLGTKAAEVTQIKIEDRTYTNKELKPVVRPLVSKLTVSTLSGLCDLLSAGFEGFNVASQVVHVVNERLVQVVGKVSNEWEDRETLMEAVMTETQGFKFGQFLSHAEFIIGLMAGFTKTDDREYLLKIASNATQEKVVTSQDDGISQQVGIKAGAHLQDQTTLRNRVQLAPYRTFREVEQPASEFVFRVQQSAEEIPRFALFEGDGGSWKLAAIENVARSLRVAAPVGTIVVS